MQEFCQEEPVEDSVLAAVERARQAQLAHEQRMPVQLQLIEDEPDERARASLRWEDAA